MCVSERERKTERKTERQKDRKKESQKRKNDQFRERKRLCNFLKLVLILRYFRNIFKTKIVEHLPSGNFRYFIKHFKLGFY